MEPRESTDKMTEEEYFRSSSILPNSKPIPNELEVGSYFDRISLKDKTKKMTIPFSSRKKYKKENFKI